MIIDSAVYEDGRRTAEPTDFAVLHAACVHGDAIAWLDCRVWGRQSAGTHSIYVGEVCATSVPHPDEPPLVYWNRGYRKLLLRE